jgi:hypothetical protein
MTDREMLAMAVSFKIAEELYVEKRGENSYCVSVFGSTVIDRDLKRHYEPMPTNRTEEFIAATRFTLAQAFDIARRYKEIG